jgi:predicted nucleic acid-binding Zn ribbon protein
VQPFQSFASAVLAETIRRQPASAARTAFAWTVAAGAAMARAASVESRNGVLLVTPKDARWSREIERASPMLLARVQALLGPHEVTTLRICAKP